jgi:acyl-CoA synthetase (AMP-forming)/AMP-acid ligase II
VVGVPDTEWGEAVQAFIVRGDPAVDAAALERHVRGTDLSSYQRPRRYHFVSELPRTSTNKVLRRALREAALRNGKTNANAPGDSQHSSRSQACGEEK